MRLYELMLVIKTSLSEADRKKLLTTIKDLIKDMKITSEEEMGQKPLAYKIKHELAGVYHVMQIESETGINADFERRLLNNENILRHLLLRKK
ncbi:30S ribosomal protein S6 [soil metagenome]